MDDRPADIDVSLALIAQLELEVLGEGPCFLEGVSSDCDDHFVELSLVVDVGGFESFDWLVDVNTKCDYYVEAYDHTEVVEGDEDNQNILISCYVHIQLSNHVPVVDHHQFKQGEEWICEIIKVAQNIEYRGLRVLPDRLI